MKAFSIILGIAIILLSLPLLWTLPETWPLMSERVGESGGFLFMTCVVWSPLIGFLLVNAGFALKRK